MYMPDEPINLAEVFRGVIIRNVDLLHRVAHKLFGPGKPYWVWIDPDGLGAWIGVASSKPMEVLSAVQREAFRTFALAEVVPDGELSWTHFRVSPTVG
jgi:hypothetical protein